MRIEAQAFSDDRFADLAERCGLADADHARGKMARLWYQCTIRASYEINNQMVSIILGPNGVDALIGSGLGEKAGRDHVRIKGTEGRIEWLKRLRDNGRKGGRPRKDAALSNTKSEPSGYSMHKPDGLAGGYPNDNPLTLTLTPALTRSDLNPLDPFFGKSQTKAKRPYRKTPKPTDLTPEESASVTVVLGKLGAQNGIAYTGSAEHARLIVARLREGTSEMDLRKVIGYCALNLGWKSDEKMLVYLRPETLFGPKTIAKYLDAARAWYAANTPEHSQ